MAHDHLTHTDAEAFWANSSDDRVTFDADPAKIHGKILDGEVVLLKDVFNPARLRQLPRQILEWSQTGDARTDTNIDECDESFHRFFENEQDLSFPNIRHYFVFHSLLDETIPDDELHRTLLPVFQSFADVYNVLLGEDYKIARSDAGPYYHPQAVHYPRGGGYFGLHRHYASIDEIDHPAQKFTLVLSLTEPGHNFERGGPRVINGDTIYDLRNQLGIGDMYAFRYDLPHAVLPIDPRTEFDWESEDGRWSLLMPMHH